MKDAIKNYFSDWFEKPEEKNATQTDTGVKESEGEGEQVQVVTTAKPVTTTRFSVSAIDMDQPDPEYLKFIQKHLEENNIPGVDYFEFAQGVRKVIASGRPQVEAFKSAFDMLTVVDAGLTPLTLQTTGKKYIQMINALKSELETECTDKITEVKTNNGKQLAQLTKQEDDLAAEERRLKERLIAIQEERTKAHNLKAELETQVSNVEQEQAQRTKKMEVAVKALTNVIEGDLSLIATHLINT